ncbi:hypothetical protein PIB30_082307, partial [Stylosanthes scabra]|nr:hypothetical protein [Stylosanthes scabra]
MADEMIKMALKTEEDELQKLQDEKTELESRIKDKEQKIRMIKTALGLLKGDTLEKIAPPEEDMKKIKEYTEQSRQQKYYYVLFDGPMKGIYDEWAKIQIHTI